MTPREAATRILASIQPLPPEDAPLADALDRVLTRDVLSPMDLPAWNNSAMDGYATRREDVTPGAVLRRVETITAGAFPTRAIGPGECARILTGAPLPDGADGVVRQEDITVQDDGGVRIDDPRDAGRNVRYRGEDLRRDAVALLAGTIVGPAQLGVLASIAQVEVPVRRRPRVAFMSSGDEIADLDERDAILAGRKIASSNTWTLLGNLARDGATASNLGIARDDPADLEQRLRRADDADLLVTTAGISVGDHDHVRSVVEMLGGRLDFWRLAMRPGAPVGFGEVLGRPWIGLPGNPVSAMVTYELFVRPAIRRLHGHALPFRRTTSVVAGEAITLRPRLTHFQRATVRDEHGDLVARLTGAQGSGILTSMARADALLIIPADVDEVKVGDALRAVLLDDPVCVAEPGWE